MHGFIKLHRSMLDWEWYGDPCTTLVFIHLLLSANFRERQYRGETIKVGECVFGVKALAEHTGLSVQQVRTALKHLQTTGEITVRATNKYSVATLENWGFYQSLCDDPTNEQQTNNKQATTPKEKKNNKKFIPPTLADVKAYAVEKQSPVDYEFFWNYYESSKWDGVKNWKQKFLTWDKKERERQGNQPQQERVKYDY